VAISHRRVLFAVYYNGIDANNPARHLYYNIVFAVRQAVKQERRRFFTVCGKLYFGSFAVRREFYNAFARLPYE